MFPQIDASIRPLFHVSVTVSVSAHPYPDQNGEKLVKKRLHYPIKDNNQLAVKRKVILNRKFHLTDTGMWNRVSA